MLRVHEYQIDRATGMAVLGRTNATRRYVSMDHLPVTVQDHYGTVKYYDDGGNEMALTDVPSYILESLLTNPLRTGSQTIEQVLKHCAICSDPVASGEYEQHLITHARAASGFEGEAPTPPKRKKE